MTTRLDHSPYPSHFPADVANEADTYLRYHEIVEATVARFRIRPVDRADAVQNTWLRFLEHAHTIREPAAIRGWLATTARRECLHIVNRAARESPTGANCEQLPASEPSPEKAAIQAEEHRAVRGAVADLGGRSAELIDALFFNTPASYAELAHRLEMPIGSIGPTRVRAIRQLRCRLADLRA